MKHIKGYTIVEILITLFIVSILLSASYFLYVNIFRGTKEESESTELQMEKVIGLEILRLDIEHLGYGIAKDATDKILEYDYNNKILTIRSTMNNTDKSSIGWVLCKNGTLYDGRFDTSNKRIVYIDVVSGNYYNVVEDGSCPSTGIYVGFPIGNSANSCFVNSKPTCNTIIYKLSDTQNLSHCNPNTGNLLRIVNNSITGEPILSCIADFKVTFDLDTNGDGVIDCNTKNTNCPLPTKNDDIRNQVKKVNVYILMQEGGLNKDYYYSGGSPIIDGIALQLPQNYQHYRWKAIKISVIPQGMYGRAIFK